MLSCPSDEDTLVIALNVISILAFIPLWLASVIRAVINKDIPEGRRIFWSICQFLIAPLIIIYAIMVEKRKTLKVAICVAVIFFGLFGAPPTSFSKALLTLQFLEKKDPEEIEILNWAEKAAQDTLTFSFYDSDQVLARSQKYFSQHGWESFQHAIEESKLLQDVQSRRLNLRLLVTGPSKLEKAEPVEGRPSWVAELPVKFTAMAAERESQTGVVGVLRLRLLSDNNKDGEQTVSINQWLLTPKYRCKQSQS